MNIISEIEKLYNELPRLDCEQCGLCCVSPTCTLAEFIYLANCLQENLSSEKLKQYLTAPAQIHPDCEGNLRCIFLENNTCTIHSARAGACRLFGIPSLLELGISDMEECKNNITIKSGSGDVSYINSWLEKLVGLDERLYDFGAEPYYIKGFNIQCWLDVYFDESLDFDVFNDIKTVMKQYFDLSEFKKHYTLKTGLKEKIDTISILSALIGSGEKEAIKKTLLSIKNDYPLTGTYFYNEAVKFLKVLDQTQ